MKWRERWEAAFATSGDLSGGKETTIISILQAMLIYGMMMVVGDPLLAGGHYGIACTGRPTKKDLDSAVKLGERVARLVKRVERLKKVLVVYESIHNGNTERMVNLIGDCLDGGVFRVGEIDKSIIQDYDVIGFGSGIYFGKHHRSLFRAHR